MSVVMKRDDRIDYLKALACIAVVCCHVFMTRGECAGYPVHWGALWLLAYTICNPLFFAIAGWLSHEESLLVYLRKKVERVLLPFCVFSLLKIFYSALISSHYAHGDTILQQLVDAFVFGRLYWFAYAIFGAMMLAPLLWKMSNVWLFVAFATSVGLSLLSGCLPAHLQIKAVFSMLPCFVAGMLARRILKSRFVDPQVEGMSMAKYGVLALSCIGIVLYLGYAFSRGTPYAVPNRISYFLGAASLALPLIWGVSRLPQGMAWLSFVGRNSWPIMLLDPFFKAMLVRIFESSYSTVLVILLNVGLSALMCRLLMRVPGHLVFGVAPR